MTLDHVTGLWVMSLETPVVTLFFLHTGKLFIIGAALGKHKKREWERAGIMLLMIETADKSIGVGVGVGIGVGAGKKAYSTCANWGIVLYPVQNITANLHFTNTFRSASEDKWKAGSLRGNIKMQVILASNWPDIVYLFPHHAVYVKIYWTFIGLFIFSASEHC